MPPDLLSLDHETVMAIRGIDLYQRGLRQPFSNKTLFLNGAKDITVDPDDQGTLPDPLQHFLQFAAPVPG